MGRKRRKHVFEGIFGSKEEQVFEGRLVGSGDIQNLEGNIIPGHSMHGRAALIFLDISPSFKYSYKFIVPWFCQSWFPSA